MTAADSVNPSARALSLNKKATLFVIVGVSARAVLLYGAVRVIVLAQLDQVEQELSRSHVTDVSRVIKTLTDEFAFRGKDWSDWNDMMEFAETPTQEWKESTFGCSVLSSTGWDIAVVYRADGTLIHADACDHVSRAETKMPPAIERLLNRDKLYKGIDTNGPPIAGLVRDGEKLYMVASRAILRADGTPGKVSARFIYGFEADGAWVERIRGFTGLDLRVTPGVAEGLTAEARVAAEGPETLVGTAAISDISGAPIATLQVSDHRSLTSYGQQILQTSLVVISVGGVLFTFATLFGMRRSVLGPIHALLRGVRTLRKGEKAHVTVSSRDELGVLGDGFNEMADAIADRETKLSQALADVRLVLDSTGDALIGCTLDGRLSGAPSLAATTWFGPPPAPDTDVAAWVFGDQVDVAAMFRMGLEEIVADFMPYELLIGQMPQRFVRDATSYGLTYRRIEHDGKLVSLLVVIADITAHIEAERAEREARELQVVVRNILRDPDDFERFLGECEGLFADVALDRPLDVRKRALHTLKGNSAIYGFISFSQRCHAVEDRLADAPECFDDAAIGELRAEWAAAVARVVCFAPAKESARVVLSVVEYQTFLDRLDRGAPHVALAAEARRWVMQPASRLFARTAQQAKRVGEQVGKLVEVNVVDHGLRLAAEPLSPLVGSLVHAVRNAVDHGLESPEERVGAGKSEVGHIEIETVAMGDQLKVFVRDDGRGIAWDRVRARAQRFGLAADTEEELAETLFRDGFTTTDAVSALSGRGVGLSAIRDACRSLGGDCVIGRNPSGVGTQICGTISLVGVTETTLRDLGSRSHPADAHAARASAAPR